MVLEQTFLEDIIPDLLKHHKRCSKTVNLRSLPSQYRGSSTLSLPTRLCRLGFSLVTPSIRADLDLIGSHFLSETKARKYEIEIWFSRRKMLEKVISDDILTVNFADDKFVPKIVDLGGDDEGYEKKLELYQPDEHVRELIEVQNGDVKAALDVHLDQRPKLYDITYDNIDITVNSNEYLLGQKDNSLHWCSSIVVEDVIDAIEISDTKHDRNILFSDFEGRIDLASGEREHLLSDYEQLVMNLIAETWPSLFPDMKVKRIEHQYSKEFNKEVKIYTGPLICETESTLEGIAVVIKSLTDELCPTAVNEEGQHVPIFPTTFSGDQKTEKSSRSAQQSSSERSSSERSNSEKSNSKKPGSEKSSSENVATEKQSKLTKTVEKPDLKNCYNRSLFSFLGLYQLLLDSIKEGNGLNCFLIQKKQLKMIHGTGHKNYACSLSSYKHIVLAHPNPQFSHRYMWNMFCGREGKSLNFARDQKNEHLNLWLKNSFKSLCVNLNSRNAQRINKAADMGVRMESKVVEFYELDSPGKSHTKKDRKDQRKQVMNILKKEEVADCKPGRKFNGPCISKNHFNEVTYRSWHLEKDKELTKIHAIRSKYFT
jgi:hypothetical protein